MKLRAQTLGWLESVIRAEKLTRLEFYNIAGTTFVRVEGPAGTGAHRVEGRDAGFCELLELARDQYERRKGEKK